MLGEFRGEVPSASATYADQFRSEFFACLLRDVSVGQFDRFLSGIERFLSQFHFEANSFERITRERTQITTERTQFVECQTIARCFGICSLPALPKALGAQLFAARRIRGKSERSRFPRMRLASCISKRSPDLK